jgi:hypothetical protein
MGAVNGDGPEPLVIDDNLRPPDARGGYGGMCVL